MYDRCTAGQADLQLSPLQLPTAFTPFLHRCPAAIWICNSPRMSSRWRCLRRSTWVHRALNSFSQLTLCAFTDRQHHPHPRDPHHRPADMPVALSQPPARHGHDRHSHLRIRGADDHLGLGLSGPGTSTLDTRRRQGAPATVAARHRATLQSSCSASRRPVQPSADGVDTQHQAAADV